MLVNYRIKDHKTFRVRVPDKLVAVIGDKFVTIENITDEIAELLISVGLGGKITLSNKAIENSKPTPGLKAIPHSIEKHFVATEQIESLDFWQICFEEEHLKKCEPFANVYFQRGLTPFFEDEVISQHQFGDKPYTGIFSYSWMNKTKNPRKISIQKHVDALNENPDVVAVGHHQHHGIGRNMWPSAERWHKGIIEMAESVLSEMGINQKLLELPVSEPFYFNNFICRTDVYKKYVEEFLQPAMRIMTENKELSARLMQDAGYVKKSQYKVKLERTIGVPHYPYHPFLLERWFSTYCALNNLKQINL